MKWAECLPGYRHLHCSEFKWYVRRKNKIKASCIFKKRKLGHPAQMLNLFSFFFFLWRKHCACPHGRNNFLSFTILLHPLPHQKGQNWSEGEAMQMCMSCAYSSQAASLPFFPLRSDKHQKAGCCQSQARCLPEHRDDVHRGEGTWALPFSPGVGRTAGTLGNRAAWGEAAQVTGGMFSSCPLQGLPRLVWLFFQIFVCRSVM